MKVVVTGGCGFIGSELVGKLVGRGDEVVVLDNLSFGKATFIEGLPVEVVDVDIRDAGKVTAAIKAAAPELVYHLAAIHFIPYCNQHPYEATDINVRGTMNVLDACEAAGVKKVFFASTAAVYQVSDNPHAESDPLVPSDVYGLSKLIGERLCSEFHLRTGAKVVAGRFFNAFGPNETNPHLIPEIIKQIAGGARTISLGNLDPKRDFIHTSDIADAVIALMGREGDAFEIFNIGYGAEFSVHDVIAYISKSLGDPIEVQVDPARVRKVERMHLCADNAKLRAIGWEPRIPFDRGIGELILSSVTGVADAS